MECVGVGIKPALRTRGGDTLEVVNTSTLRSLNISGLIDKHRPRGVYREMVVIEEPGGRNIELLLPPDVARSNKGGRPPQYPMEHWREVARVYREAYANNRTPTRAVARHWEKQQSTAAKWVARCREMGLLPATSKGKARSVTTPQRRRTPRRKAT